MRYTKGMEKITAGSHVMLIDSGLTGRVKNVEYPNGLPCADIRLDTGQGFPKSKATYTRVNNLRLIKETP